MVGDPLTIVCPKCGADATEMCRDLRGPNYSNMRPHRERKERLAFVDRTRPGTCILHDLGNGVRQGCCSRWKETD